MRNVDITIANRSDSRFFGGIAKRCITLSVWLFLLLVMTTPSSLAELMLEVERIASDLNRPVFATTAPGDENRLFIVEQHTGNIMIHNLDTGATNSTPFLTVGDLATGNEQGLLGLAFHPDFDNNGLFYTNSTSTDSVTRIQQYQVSPTNPNIANPGSVSPVLSFNQPQANHNGGWLGFGPDGLLYVASGDGGGANDSGTGHTTGIGNAQDITDNLLGKILRIDVNNDDFSADLTRNYAIPGTNPFVDVEGDDEIWAYGLRNPWRVSFDRETDDLYIADVGQNSREEINFQPASSNGGENYGWRLREGTIATPSGGVGGAAPEGAINPIYEYIHGSGPTQGFSVTGGYVYRGPIPELQGKYIFADFVNRRLWSFEFDGSDASLFNGSNITDFVDWTDLIITDEGSIGGISSFGEDNLGNLFIVDLDGEIFRVNAAVPEPTSWAMFAILIVSLVAVIRKTRRQQQE